MHLTTAAADMSYLNSYSFDIYDIAQLNRTFHRQNQTADKVADDILGAKTGTDRQCAAKKCENGEWYVYSDQRKTKMAMTAINANSLKLSKIALSCPGSLFIRI